MTSKSDRNEAALWTFGIGPIAAGLIVVGYQVLNWLQSGKWTPLSVLSVLRRTHINDQWAALPTSWVGVWRILSWTPVSLLLTACGLLFLASFIAAPQP